MIEIPLKPLSSVNFSSYGEVLLIHKDQAPNSAGEGWECWYPLGRIDTERNMFFGIVRSQLISAKIDVMERHQDRVEYLIPLDRPIIQTVGLSRPDSPNSPDESRTEAFVIYPGQIAMINRGIWHAAGLALGPEATQYLFLLGEPSAEVIHPDSGLTRFTTDEYVQIIVPANSS